MITETYIRSLLDGDHDYHQVIKDLEGLFRIKGPGLEAHHIEPERTRVIWLTPLEHLAIHIAHAKVEKTGPFYAKVAAFVKFFPGSYRRQLLLSPDLQKKLISFGQKRPEQGVNLNQHPNTVAARKSPTEKQRQAARENGKKGAKKTQEKLLGREIRWNDKISNTIQSLPMCCCIRCGKEMKAWPSNIIQHQRSSKCVTSSPNALSASMVGLRWSALLPALVAIL